MAPGMECAQGGTRGRMMGHEENIIIRAAGAELLTVREPRKMPVIG